MMSAPSTRFTRRLFEPHVGTRFEVRQEDGASIGMELAEANDTTPQGFDGEQFSLIFRGPSEPALTQRIYRMRHEVIGTTDLFIVPIAATPEHRLYEAYFNLKANPEG